MEEAGSVRGQTDTLVSIVSVDSLQRQHGVQRNMAIHYALVMDRTAAGDVRGLARTRKQQRTVVASSSLCVLEH